MTLKTGVVAAENSALPCQELITFDFFLIKINKIKHDIFLIK